MSRTNPDGSCDFCGASLATWDYRYRGGHYCRRCYDVHFVLDTCTVCGKTKKIDRELKTPVCKTCQIKDKPCIRCGREIKRHGRIEAYGPVCASCAKYFKEPERCPECGMERRDVFLRDIDGERTKLCEKCYRKQLPTCALCQRKKKPYRLDEKGRSVCEACATKVRQCRECGKEIPGGRGRICLECASKNGIRKKIRFATGGLPPITAEAFASFAKWFEAKRGAQVASRRVLEYFPFFMEIGRMEEGLGRLPEYKELAYRLSVKRLWENRLATEFFDSTGLIGKDAGVQTLIAERDMIERMLHAFRTGSFFANAVNGYYDVLAVKLENRKTTLRSVRLALTPVKRFGEYCAHCGVDVPTQTELKGYLWTFPGQKSALTGFVNHLNRKFGMRLDIRGIGKPVLHRPKSSRKHLEQKLIDMLRDEEILAQSGRDGLLRTAIGYFHEVLIPDSVKIGVCEPKYSSREGTHFIRCAGEDFWLPEEVVRAFRAI